jgi:hypothetical protein
MEENEDVKYHDDEKSSITLLKQQNIIQRQHENIQVTHACSAIYAMTQVAHCIRLIQECKR